MAVTLLNLCRTQISPLTSLLKPTAATTFRFSSQASKLPHKKSIYKTEAKKIRFYVVHRYLEYLKNYDKVLERSFPGALHVYRIFTIGLKDFVRDLKDYFRIIRLMNVTQMNKFQSLTRREIELYHQMPKDMFKVAPVLLLSPLPFAYYVIFPLAYFWPRLLLSSHFWTLQQKAEYHLIYLKNRLSYNRPLFRCVQAELDKLKNHQLHDHWAMILGMMGSGVQPSVEQILKCKSLFMCEPYHLFYLKRKHVKYLLKIHDLHTSGFRRTRLVERAIVLKEMDKAIVREGGVHNMPVEALKNACYIRGLNPLHMRNEDMITWLQNWVAISTAVDKDNLSLILHCPILLAYNEPSNWALIYENK